jgi:outer membrane protein
MMKFFKLLFPALLCCILVAMGCEKKGRVGYVQNAKLFQSFTGTIELEAKVKTKKVFNNAQLDSLRQLIDNGREDLRDLYSKKADEYGREETQLTEQFTSEIWAFINSGITEYGEVHGYDFIFGATGDGSLMFARESTNVTDSVIQFINHKYSGQSK